MTASDEVQALMERGFEALDEHDLDSALRIGAELEFVIVDDDMRPNPIAVELLEKLANAGGDPLKRAKEELGALGEPAADALRRLFDESYTNAELGPVVENVLDAAALNPTDTSHGVIRRALDHPMEAVRHRAMIGMIARHAKPSDFDVFAERVGGPESVEMQRLQVQRQRREQQIVGLGDGATGARG